MTQPRDGSEIHDVIGVGFGPSNLALAVAIHEHNRAAGSGRGLNARFLERRSGFGWHRGMLIDDATMQVSFLKDLVTLRNPSSDFSFLSYLHARGRLVDFVNHKTLFPLRVEFHDYFEWAASRVDHLVSYDSDVVAVRPVPADAGPGGPGHPADPAATPGAEVVALDVHTADGARYRTRNVVLAPGLRPRLPDGVCASDRVWHNSELLHRVDALDAPARCVVLGAGQSAAETTALLHDRFPGCEICPVFARFGYSPADDSPFANRVFDPAAVDEFHAAPPETRTRLLDQHANTNYSVVDLDLIEELYRRHYRERVLGTERLRMFATSRVTDVREHDSGVRVGIESLTSGETTTLDADVLVCATGYRPSPATALLGETAAYCRTDAEGRLRADRDYRVATVPGLRAGIYVQGGEVEHTHGITASLLSNNAVRSGEILESLLARQQAGPDAPVPSGDARELLTPVGARGTAAEPEDHPTTRGESR